MNSKYQTIKIFDNLIVVDKMIEIREGDWYYFSQHNTILRHIKDEEGDLMNLSVLEGRYKIIASYPKLYGVAELCELPPVDSEAEGLAEQFINEAFGDVDPKLDEPKLLCKQFYIEGYRTAKLSYKYSEKMVRDLVDSVTEFMSHNEPEQFDEWFERKIKRFNDIPEFNFYSKRTLLDAMNEAREDYENGVLDIRTNIEILRSLRQSGQTYFEVDEVEEYLIKDKWLSEQEYSHLGQNYVQKRTCPKIVDGKLQGQWKY